MKRTLYKGIAMVLAAILVMGFSPVYALNPDFRGTIDKTVALPDILTFSAADLRDGDLTFIPEDADAGNPGYTIDENMPVRLSSVYFSELFQESNGRELSYVKFTLPSAERGVLYIDYTSPTLYEARVLETTKYYTGTYPNISRISFVPAEDFSGTVSIPYTGYTENHAGYWGMLTIEVQDTDAKDIVYTVDQGTVVSFRTVHFNNVCQEATGDALSYVTFTLPAPAHGKLYLNYSSSTDFDALVSAGTRYYSDAEPNLSDVDFVPAAGLIGTIEIMYKGYSVESDDYSGVITVKVEEEDEEESEDSDHFHDVGKNISWAVEAIDYLYEQGILLGDGAGYYNPQASISRGDFIVMLSRAFDIDGDFEDNFSDVEEDDYYYKAVGAAKKFGITKGANGKFNPRSALSRQDATVLILRALEVADIELEDGDDDDLVPFKDKNKIPDYAREAFQALVQAGIIEGTGKHLNPDSSVSRAEIAVILHRILTM